MLYLNIMRVSRKLMILGILVAIATLSLTRPVVVVSALQIERAATLIFTPPPVTLAPTLGATATVDPASIGDTSGVMAFGMIVVFIILVGVLWGSYEFRMDTKKNGTPRE